MNKIDLLRNAVARIGYTAKKVHIQGCVARVETTEDDILDIYLTERKRQQIDDVCFSTTLRPFSVIWAVALFRSLLPTLFRAMSSARRYTHIKTH